MLRQKYIAVVPQLDTCCYIFAIDCDLITKDYEDSIIIQGVYLAY